MTDLINRMCDYASGGCVVDRHLITKAEDTLRSISNERDDLRQRLAAAEALNQPRMSLHAEIARLQQLLNEHAETIKHYREKYEQERQNRQKAEARQYSVGAAHLREYAARVKERDEARTALSGVAPCGHENRFIEWEDHSKPISCVVCEIESLRQRLAAAEALLREICETWERNESMTKAMNLEWNGAIVNPDHITVIVTRDWYKAANGGRDE